MVHLNPTIVPCSGFFLLKGWLPNYFEVLGFQVSGLGIGRFLRIFCCDFSAMRHRGVSRRNRQQFQEVWVSLVDLVRTIFVNGVMVMLAPFLVPISLAIQLWNSLPSFRQVKKSIPRSFSEVKRIPYSIWHSIPSAGELGNMLLRLIQTLVRDCLQRYTTQDIGRSPRQPAFWSFFSLQWPLETMIAAVKCRRFIQSLDVKLAVSFESNCHDQLQQIDAKCAGLRTRASSETLILSKSISGPSCALHHMRL